MTVLKIIGRLFTALFALVVIAGLVTKVVGNMQVKGQLASLKSAGMPVSISDLKGKPLPDSQNAARIYEQAFAVMAEPGIHKDVVLLCDMFPAGREVSQQEWLSAAAAVKRCDRLYELLETAQSKPLCQFPILISSSNKTTFEQMEMQRNKQFKSFAKFREMARLFGIKAVICAHSGDASGAAANIESAFRTNSIIAEKPSLIEYMVGEAMTGMSLDNLRKSLNHCSFNDAQIHRLDSALSKRDAEKLYRNALIGERVYHLATNESLISGGLGWLPQSGMDTAAYLDFMKLQIDNTDLTYSQALAKGIVGDKHFKQLPSYAIIAQMMAPVIARTGVLRYKTEATIACCRVSLALEAFRSKSGEYPNTLAELKMKLPLDPFTGKGLIYKPMANGYIVYSLGPNQKDDGGVDQKTAGAPKSADDVAWKIER